MNTTTLPTAFQDARRALLGEGYSEGTPDRIDEEDRAVDKRCCRALACPSCRKRGMAYTPFHTETAYRVLARCGRCGSCEEV